MANNDMQETLDRILAELRSDDKTRQLAAIRELELIPYSSEAIVRELEQLALIGEGVVPRIALNALNLKTSRFVASKLSSLPKYDRQLILREVVTWQDNGLIQENQAEIIRRHYDFDIKPATPAQPTSAKAVSEPKETQPAIAEASGEGSKQEREAKEPSIPTGPRPSLTQTLLSEASIKVYLYLGAFFVIASALILAALVEAARLPILAVATLAFGASALVIRRRLPQPSFALFIVFSFLLPIDANVLEETMGLVEPSLSIYWTIIFLAMAVIWAFSVWFYESRFLSAVAFVSFSLAFYRAGVVFNTEPELQIFLGMLASLMGLAGTSELRKWKNHKFSLLIFLLAQLQVLGLLLVSMGFALIHTFDSGLSNGWWILIVLTWLTAAAFYAVSDLLMPKFFFPWMAVGALLPLPWFFLNTFDTTQPVYTFGFWIWGAGLALASEAARRISLEKLQKYHWALLAGSAALFLAAFSLALIWNEPVLSFAIFTLTAALSTALHLLRPRWYVWSAALLSALFAYFTFFHLPILDRLEVPLVYQLLLASTLLLTPELFARVAISLKSESRWPALPLGIGLSVFCLVLALAELGRPGRGALVLIVYAVLFTLHALHGKREWLLYFAAASESLALVFALDYFDLDGWLPVLTALFILYYAAGFFLRRIDAIKAWGGVLIHSGLTLGVLLSLTALALSKETSGWYIILMALLFAVELFARRLTWMELIVESLLTLALYLILDDFNVNRIGHFLFGASLIWLGGDLIIGRLVEGKRIHQPIVLGAGFVLVFLSTFTLWGELNPVVPTIYLLLYALFFTASAVLQREPRLGYLVTAFLPIAAIKLSGAADFEKWIFPLIGLAILYYSSGHWLRRNQRANGWDTVLVHSGLGLGVVTSMSAPFQGGLEASIPVAIAATLFAAEAFALRNVWWALPANALYLMSYFMILSELNVEEPQFYSIGAALLGMLMHYLLTRAGSRTGAFIAGMLSQFVLLGVTYYQMISTERLSFFVILFVQGMIVLAYGLIERSRSLVITPIAFVVLGVVSVIYSALKGLGTVILIGTTGVALLLAGIAAVLMRERITRLGEQLSDWRP